MISEIENIITDLISCKSIEKIYKDLADYLNAISKLDQGNYKTPL